jgi:HD-GYP domain-containing protein (c-di-GMP phosphodiesterase class II)
MYASAIAVRMGFDEQRVDDIRAAALLHDIGKLETSREILHKVARLSAEEMRSWLAERLKEHLLQQTDEIPDGPIM